MPIGEASNRASMREPELYLPAFCLTLPIEGSTWTHRVPSPPCCHTLAVEPRAAAAVPSVAWALPANVAFVDAGGGVLAVLNSCSRTPASQAKWLSG